MNKMRIFGIRIMWERNYRQLLHFKKDIKEILRKKLPVVDSKELSKKKIILKGGLVLIDSTLKESSMDIYSDTAVDAFYYATITNCVFNGKKR